ncbi:MAG: AbrB/MazE/SpoVT family DNA-binding domain-containing protein [Euryarchaeota archaeon]|nr:AbrB/MazE/SpoVT family DNA-binding domain-containing protein [Euryarchaeota archaeon]
MTMESRKLQFTGRSTYVVSLPKAWVRERGLKAGDRVLIEVTESGDLLIRADASRVEEPRTKSLDISGLSPRQIERRVVSAYLFGFDELRITSRHRILPDQREAVMNILRRILGTEVLAETSHEMVVNDLLDFKEISPRSILRRMQVIAEFMFKNAVEAFFSRDRELAKDVIARDEEVDKFYLLATREIIEGIRRAGRANIDVPPEKAVHYLSVARSLERIADHSVKISSLVGRTPPEEVAGELRKLYAEVVENFEKASRSFFSGDVNLADAVLDARDKLQRMVSSLLEQIEDKPGTIGAFTLLDSFQRVYAYSADIAESTLDMNI